MLELRRRINQTITPDRSLGQLLATLRMKWQTLPMRFSRQEDDQKAFLKLCDLVVPKYSMVSVDRLQSMYRLSLETARKGLPGAIVECGTWNGGAAALMAGASLRGGVTRDVWLYDSFEGLPPPTDGDPADVHESYFEGWCCGSPDLAREINQAVGLPDDKIHVVKGWFEQTLPGANVGPIAVLHVDSDWYQSVKDTLISFYDAVVPGGVIIFDDYALWSGCRKAVDEFLGERGMSNKLQESGRVARYLVKE